jgi:hypothetical protein
MNETMKRNLTMMSCLIADDRHALMPQRILRGDAPFPGHRR